MKALAAVGVEVKTGCEMVGLARASFYRLSRGYRHYRPASVPIAHRERRQPAALCPAERDVIINVLTDPEIAKQSVQQAYWLSLDKGILGCSQRTFYRVAKAENLVGDMRRRRTGTGKASRCKPIVHADKVGDLWSWDITELRGPRTQDRYKLYLVLDVFSRYPVAWRIEYVEDKNLVMQMFEKAFNEHGIPAVVHADNGAVMRAHDVVKAFLTAGAAASYSRPRVSDDNPFSESLFKTIKYDLTCPNTFDSIDHARQWTEQFLHDYAQHHRHSGLGHYTPASVHHDTAHLIRDQRQQTLNTYYQQHPERFRNAPQAPELPKPTGINTKLSQAG